jgi:hypothetical protein
MSAFPIIFNDNYINIDYFGTFKASLKLKIRVNYKSEIKYILFGY